MAKRLSTIFGAGPLEKIQDQAASLSSGDEIDASTFEALSGVLRMLGATGILAARQYNNNIAFEPESRKHDAPFAAINLHDHSNYRLMPGLAEFAGLVNGWPFWSRHQDYKPRRSVPAPTDELGTELIEPPPIPADVLAKPLGLTGATVDLTGDTQMRWLSRVYEDSPEHVDMYLAGIELWWEKRDGDALRDADDSFRHAHSVTDLYAMYEKSTRLAATGSKELLENLPFAPVAKRYVDADGQPQIAYLNMRMICAKVGTLASSAVHQSAPIVTIAISDSHSHVLTEQMTDAQAADLRSGAIATVTLTSTDFSHDHDYEITWDGTWYVGVDTHVGHQHAVLIERGFDGSVPYDRTKALAGTIDDTNLFTVIDDPASRGTLTLDEFEQTRLARFRVANLERMVERVPGLDGEGSFLPEYSYAGEQFLDRDGGDLNGAYYSLTYNRGAPNASGRTSIARSFNDPNLCVAQTSKTFVLDSVSYFIPLEILAISPIHGANPYNFAIASTVGESGASGSGTQGAPYTKIFEETYWYTLPVGMYVPQGAPDPADTGRTAWVADSGAVAREVYSGGIRPHTPDFSHRLRYPVYSMWQEYSYESVRLTGWKRSIDEALLEKAQYSYGPAASRPAAPATGQSHFDTTLGHAIWYDGTEWIDSYGQAVDLSSMNLAFGPTNTLAHRIDTTNGSAYTATYPNGTVVSIASGVTHTQALPANTSGVMQIAFADGATPTRFESLSGTWSFYLDDLPSSLTRLVVTGTNTIKGSMAKAPRGLTYLHVTGSNTITGNLSNAPVGLTYVYLTGNSSISGDIANIPKAVTYFYVVGTTTISGNIANAPSSLVGLLIGGSTTVSGSIVNAPSGLTELLLLGTTTLTGDIANAPSALKYLYVTGSNTLTTTGRTWVPGMTTVYIHGAAKSQSFVDSVLSTLARDATTWTLGKAVNLAGSNAAPSGAAATDISTLQGRGVTVTVN